MQAIPTIPTDPINAGQAADPRPAVDDASDDRFSQHLATASKSIDSTGRNVDKELSTAVDKDFSRHDGENGTTTDEITTLFFSAGDLQPVLVAPQNKQVTPSSFTSNSQQNTLFLALAESIEVQDKTAQQSTLKNQITPLDSLLDRAVITGDDKTASLVSKPSSGQTPTEITVESWRAQFSYQNRTNAQGTDRANAQGTGNQQLGPGQALHTGQGNLQEPVPAYISPEADKFASTTRPSSGSGVNFPNQPRDANSNYIHSNLPGVNIKTEGESNKNTGQQNSDGQKNMTREPLAQQELAPTAKSTQDTPLIFTLDQERTAGLMPQSQTTSTSLMLKLPSGTEVPQSHVMNQVIDRFTLNRTLESGSITLKLYPEELGELRMELKVDQDNIKAHITTQNPQVQEILDRHLPRLREALEQQGFNLEQMKVTVAADDDSSGQLFQEHFNSQHPKRSQRSNTDQLAFSLDQDIQDEGEVSERQQNLNVLV